MALKTISPANAGAKYAESMKPYLDMLSRLKLPVRKARGSITNYRRCAKVAKALAKESLRQREIRQRERSK